MKDKRGQGERQGASDGTGGKKCAGMSLGVEE